MHDPISQFSFANAIRAKERGSLTTIGSFADVVRRLNTNPSELSKFGSFETAMQSYRDVQKKNDGVVTC